MLLAQTPSQWMEDKVLSTMSPAPTHLDTLGNKCIISVRETCHSEQGHSDLPGCWCALDKHLLSPCLYQALWDLKVK